MKKRRRRIRSFVLVLLGALGLASVVTAATTERASSRGEWCGCLAGPDSCARPCRGCCRGTSEAACFSGMDPSTKAPHGSCASGR